MRRIVVVSLAGCLAAGLACAPWLLRGREPEKAGADKPADRPPDKAAEDGPAQFPNISGLADPAFDRYVDLTLAGHAWQGQDAAGLTDAALQLAEGERILLRTHKSGLTAQKLLSLAANLAADQKDKATLDRLARAAEAQGDKRLAAQVGSARKLADAARDVDPVLLLPADTTTPEEFSLFRTYLQDVRAAKQNGDAVTLEAIEMELPGRKALAPERRDYLAKLARESRSALPPADAEAKKAVDALGKLAAGSRDDNNFDISFDYINSPDYGPQGGTPPQPRPPAPHPKPAPIQRDFTLVNKCPFPVRIQYVPGGKPWAVPANSSWNQRWISGNGTRPAVVLLATGQSYLLENAHFQLYQGPDGNVAWGYAP